MIEEEKRYVAYIYTFERYNINTQPSGNKNEEKKCVNAFFRTTRS